MSPIREQKLLAQLLRTKAKPINRRSLLGLVLTIMVWGVAAYAILSIAGGAQGITNNVLALVAIGFALGLFTLFDFFRQRTLLALAVQAQYLDVDAIERRISELRT